MVVIHDGVRPFIETELLERTIKAANDHRAVITALPQKKPLKRLISRFCD
jgi:2-C-methyl-D-erythritol 4-phosphate cytidylyltransferase